MIRPSVAVVEYAECPQPPRWPSVVLASALHSSEFAVSRLQVHDLGAEALLAWCDAHPPNLIFLDSRFSIRSLRKVCSALKEIPLVLQGPYALDRFELTTCDFAFVGPIRLEAATLAHRVLRSKNGRSRLRSIPRLLIRSETSIWQMSEDWTPPSALEILGPATETEGWEYLGPQRRSPGPPRPAEIWSPSPEARPDPPLFGLEGEVRRTEHLLLPSLDSRFDTTGRSDRSHPFAGATETSLYEWRETLPLQDVLQLVDVQTHHYLQTGARTLALKMDDPFDLIPLWARRLADAEVQPREVHLSPTVPALKRVTYLPEALQPLLDLGVHVRVVRVPFFSFDDRNLKLLGHGATHWENRWVARLLIEAEGYDDGRIRSVDHHRLLLLDPWSRMADLLDSLVAIEEDAPFLKASVHPGSVVEVESRYSPIGRRAEADGLLSTESTRTGWSYSFAHEETALYVELAHRGMVPLLETIGRMKLAPLRRQEVIEEARFRWMRELAVHLQRSRDSHAAVEESWGKVLGSVVRELATDVRKDGPQ